MKVSVYTADRLSSPVCSFNAAVIDWHDELSQPIRVEMPWLFLELTGTKNERRRLETDILTAHFTLTLTNKALQ